VVLLPAAAAEAWGPAGRRGRDVIVRVVLDRRVVLVGSAPSRTTDGRRVDTGWSVRGRGPVTLWVRGAGHDPEPTSRNGYLVILVTRPAPTVRPPSRIANFNPSSIAIGWINSTDISVLSPGITISTPSGNVTAPVTSVVRK
jgi:hypothetical protein